MDVPVVISGGGDNGVLTFPRVPVTFFAWKCGLVPPASQTGGAQGKYSSACPEMRVSKGTGSAPGGGTPGAGNVLYLHLHEDCTDTYIYVTMH